MAGGEGFHLTVSDVPALGLHPESASYCFKQAFVAAGAAADARVTEIKTSRSGDRRFGPRHAALLQKLQAAKEKVPSERTRLSTKWKWQSLDEYSGKWLRGEQSGDGTCKLQAQRALRAARHCRP